MTDDEIRSTKAYKEGWYAYNEWYENGGKWPEEHYGAAQCPYLGSTVEYDLWYIGANSAYGNNAYLPQSVKRGRLQDKFPGRLPPLDGIPQVQVQLSLFD